MLHVLVVLLADREEGRLKDGYRELQSKQEKLSELMNTYENNLFKTNSELEKIRKQMNWEKQVQHTCTLILQGNAS